MRMAMEALNPQQGNHSLAPPEDPTDPNPPSCSGKVSQDGAELLFGMEEGRVP